MLTLLPPDLDESAKSTGALERKRSVRSGAELLRLAMAYGVCGLSLRGISAWASVSGVAKMSDVAILKRLRKCGDWLNLLITQKLAERMSFPELFCRGRRLRIADASCVNRPGRKGTDWRLHLSFQLGSMLIDDAQLTGAEGGETLRRFAVTEGDVLLGDRIYGERRGIAGVVASGGDVVVRISWQNMPLQNPDGTTFDILEHARALGQTEPGEWAVKTAPCAKKGIVSVSGRLVALRKSQAAAERERRKVRKQYSKKGRTPDKRTFEACDYILVFTTLMPSEASAQEALELYRFRWQIELVFKRLKSILHMDQMAARSDELCRTFLLAKLLAALLVEDLGSRVGAFSPWGYGRPSPCVPREIVRGSS